MLKAIIFDAYGTLFFTGNGSVNAVRRILTANGHPEMCAEEVYAHWKVWHRKHMEELPDFRTEAEIYALDLEELYRQYGFSRDPRQDVAMMLQIQGTRVAFPEVKEVVEELGKEYVIAIGSTTDTAPLMKDLERSALPITKIFTSESLHLYKPREEFYTTILAELGLSPSEALFVGDSLLNDVEGPKKVGLHTCWINRNHQKALSACPDFEIQSMTQLLQVVKQIS